MADVTAKLAEALRKTIDLAEYWFTREDRRGYSKSEYTLWHSLGFGSITMQQAREALAAYEQAQAEPKQAAEPFAYVDRVSLLWLSDEVRTPVARVETSLYKTAPGDGWVGVYLAAPVAQAEPRKPLTDDQHRRMCALYFGDCSARMHDFLIEYGKRVEAAHGIKEQP